MGSCIMDREASFKSGEDYRNAIMKAISKF